MQTSARYLTSALLLSALPLSGQMMGANSGMQVTLATGDSRIVTEPTFPTVCSKFSATKFIVLTNTLNLDPYNLNPTDGSNGCTGGAGHGTLGCTGGWSYEPSSTAAPTFTNDETDDESALLSALNACPTGQAVEIVPSGSKRAVVLGMLTIPTGKSLILDAGIHVYASRDRTIYAVSPGGPNCGIVTTGVSGCHHWITASSPNNGSGIYGYGVLDGRGWDLYLSSVGPPVVNVTPSTMSSFYSARAQAYINNRGISDGLPNGSNNGLGNNSYGPNLVHFDGATNFTMYKVTLKDSGNFNLAWRRGTGGTFWGVKILGPFEIPNTDGWDPISSVNGTYTHGVVSNGDNHMSVKGQDNEAKNITFSFNQTGAGSGIVTGADPSHGITNVLVTDIVQRGNLGNPLSVGLQIASSLADGGTTNKITMQNVCMQNEARSIRIYPNYNAPSLTGTNYSYFNNIVLQHIHVLASTAGKSGRFTFQGYDAAHAIIGQLNDVTIDGTNEGVSQQDTFTKDQYGYWYIGPQPVASSIVTTQFGAGISAKPIGSAGTSTPYPCTASMWHPLVGELNLNTTGNHNLQSYNGAAPYTLEAIVEPTTAVNDHEQPWPNGSVQFKDTFGGTTTVIGTVAIQTQNKDGIYALFSVSSAASGTHVYTANYTGDTNTTPYADMSFGSITVVVP